MGIKQSVREVFFQLRLHMPWLSYEERFRFFEVDPGKLFRSSQPTPPALDYFMAHYHIRSLIILREKGDEKEIAHAKSCGLKICHIPIKHHTSPTETDVKKFFDFLSDKINRPALVHCLQGRDRTGYLCFVYRIEEMGWTTNDAWEEMKKFGFFSLPWHNRTQGHIKELIEQQYNRKFE